MSDCNLLADPIEQFKLWLEQELGHDHYDPMAMSLATIGSQNKPSCRIVLLKKVDNKGFTFYTNYHSHKGRDIAVNPSVALTFYWPVYYRQIRIEGDVEKLCREESIRYFDSRDGGSQIAAWVSEQSQVIPDRNYLLERYNKYRQQMSDEVRCPEFWGGYLVKPTKIEFWLGKDHRLHDRFCYIKENQQWKILRLAP